ncbi:glycosyltransferase [Methylobacterium segetis]|uniref:glycosyltransferase n=1 Tax=Methylobacterium segetis TaxID=2488750 RepID=UPI0010461CF3|nr:glycosyltransferase [Methylobacterium segetis]
MRKPVVELYTVCWDEADMLGFFFRHYDAFVDRYVVYDDGSTDGSREILRAHPRVELRDFARVAAESFVLSHKAMQDEAWKESRGRADWVIVTAIDEHLHVPGRPMAEYLAEQADHGVTLIPALGFDMNHKEMPDDSGLLVERVTRGRPRIAFNKLSVFRPDAVRESGFTAGRHAAEPVGDLRLPTRDALMLWHYKHLGFARNAAREAAQAERLGRVDRAQGYGQHYLWGEARLRAFWDEMEREARDLSAEGFDPEAAAIRPLWWETQGLPRADPIRIGAEPAPAVSVLVKSYNHAPYVAQTIRSLLDQSFQDFEIVVTDDASTDATAAIVRGFDDPRIRLEVSPENRGISGAMNATIARARGRYLAILNSDDWALPGRLARQAAFLDANPDVSAVFGMPRAVDEGGTPTVPFNDFRAPLRLPDFSRRSWLRQFFFHGNCLCAPTAMIRREAYTAAGRYDPRLTNYQDLDMWIRMLVSGQTIHVLDEELTAFRIRAGDANLSAPRADTQLRSAFEKTKLLRHFATLDRATFEEVFGPGEDGWGEDFPHDRPVALCVAELARRIPRVEYNHFALEIFYEAAERTEDFHRLRTEAGTIDAFGLQAVTARDRIIADLSRQPGFGFAYPHDAAECARLSDLVLLYRLALGRDPDDGGLRHHLDFLRAGGALSSVVRDFVGSAEFGGLCASSDPAAVLCRQAAGRAPEAAERTLAPADLALALLRSPEVRARHAVLPILYPDGLPPDVPHLYAWWAEEAERLRDALPPEGVAERAGPALSIVVLIDHVPDAASAAFLRRMAGALDAAAEIVLAPVGADCAAAGRAICSGQARIACGPAGEDAADALHRAQGLCRGLFTGLVRPGDGIAVAAIPGLLPLLDGADVLLADEDVRSPGGRRSDPAFNGRWDPDACLARPPSSLVLFRSELVAPFGGWAAAGAGTADPLLIQWGLLLRAGRHLAPERIRPAHRILVHRREEDPAVPDTAAMAEVLERFLTEGDRRPATVERGAGILRPRYVCPDPPKVTIVVPTRDRLDLLGACVESVLSGTRYPRFEILVIDNGSSCRETLAYLADRAADPRFRVLPCGGIFNWARLNNLGVARSDGAILVLLNNDTVVLEAGWLEELVALALRPEIGVVGAKLSYPDDRVQHAGIEIGADGEARHVWRHAPRTAAGYSDQLRIVRNVSAVTGACMAFRREVFDALGGFDETLRVTWNDVDFCLRAREAGLRVLWTPHAELHHHEGATRPVDASPQDARRFAREAEQARANRMHHLAELGYQSPNLLIDGGQPSLATRPLAALAEHNRAAMDGEARPDPNAGTVADPAPARAMRLPRYLRAPVERTKRLWRDLRPSRP